MDRRLRRIRSTGGRPCLLVLCVLAACGVSGGLRCLCIRGCLGAPSPAAASRGRGRRIGPLHHPTTRLTRKQNPLKLAAPLDREAHTQCHLLTGKPLKIRRLFQRPIQPRGRNLQAGEVHPFDFQNPNQLSARGLAIIDGRPQGLARTVNKDAQEPPSDELKVNEFIAQARERLLNDQL